MDIRPAQVTDSESIRDLYLKTFPDSENTRVAALALSLLSDETEPSTYSLIAVNEKEVIAHVACSPVWIDNETDAHAYILAPLCVNTHHQKQGIGSALVRSAMEQLLDEGVDILFVYGDPAYYNRFDFSVEQAGNYLPPYPLEYPHGWQAVQLSEQPLAASQVKLSCVSGLSHAELW